MGPVWSGPVTKAAHEADRVQGRPVVAGWQEPGARLLHQLARGCHAPVLAWLKGAADGRMLVRQPQDHNAIAHERDQ